jgi:hypothetical protein
MAEEAWQSRSHKVQRRDPIRSLFARSILNGYSDEAVSLVLARVAMSENRCIDRFDTLKWVRRFAPFFYSLTPVGE